MLIHSIVPHRLIFDERKNDIDKFEKQYINFENGILEVGLSDDNSYRINRIITTSLKPYLDDDYQPGSLYFKK